MKKNKFIIACSSVVAIAGALSVASAQIPDSFVGKFPKPKSHLTRYTFWADMNANIPIVILVNRTGGTLTDYTQLNIDVHDVNDGIIGIMSHAKANLPNGQQRIIAPYIRSGGTVRMVYQIDGRTYPSWNSKGPLQAGVPMVLTFLPKGKVTVNKPYVRE